MRNTYPLVLFTLESLKDFKNQDFAEAVIRTLAKYGKDYCPDVYGVYEPLKNKYNPKDTAEVVRMWMNAENNVILTEQSYATGSLVMKKRKKHMVSYSIRWQKYNQARFNSFDMFINLEYLEKESNFKKFMQLCTEWIELFEPVYGEIANWSLPGVGQPFDLRIRLPEINWTLILGEPYIQLFGREKLMSTPCHSVRPIGDHAVALQMTENLFEPVPLHVRTAVKLHLGEDAFVEEGKTSRSYKTGKVPEFDFSNVLFDLTQPIVEPQIKMRNQK